MSVHCYFHSGQCLYAQGEMIGLMCGRHPILKLTFNELDMIF